MEKVKLVPGLTVFCVHEDEGSVEGPMNVEGMWHTSKTAVKVGGRGQLRHIDNLRVCPKQSVTCPSTEAETQVGAWLADIVRLNQQIEAVEAKIKTEIMAWPGVEV